MASVMGCVITIEAQIEMFINITTYSYEKATLTCY